MTAEKGLHVLFIDDSPADREFLAIAFRRQFPSVEVSLAEDGDGGIARLRGQASDGKRAPTLVLLDLKLPGKDGIAILRDIRGDPALHRIPVVMLTSSRLEEDVARSYDAGANAYVPKPADATGYGSLASELHRFWTEISLLPGGSQP